MVTPGPQVNFSVCVLTQNALHITIGGVDYNRLTVNRNKTELVMFINKCILGNHTLPTLANKRFPLFSQDKYLIVTLATN